MVNCVFFSVKSKEFCIVDVPKLQPFLLQHFNIGVLGIDLAISNIQIFNYFAFNRRRKCMTGKTTLVDTGCISETLGSTS